MPDPGDLTLRRGPGDVEPPPERSGLPIWPIVIVLAILAGAGAYWWRASRAKPQPQPATAAQPVKPPSSASNADSKPLPPLDDMDALVRQLVSALSSHPQVAAWLTTDDLLRNVAVTMQNVADGANPNRHLKTVAPEGPFRVTKSGGRIVLDPRSYQRYDGHAGAVDSLDAAGVARLYQTVKPRLEEAHKEVDPSTSLDATLKRALTTLVSTPVVEDPVYLEPSGGVYRFADPRLEALTPAQRQLLRMGPRNMRIVQQKLRDIAAQLEIPLDKAP